MTDEHERDTWTEYRRMVLSELERLCENVIAMGAKLDAYHSVNAVRIQKLELDVRDLKTRAMLAGAFMGVLGSVIGWLVHRMFPVGP